MNFLIGLLAPTLGERWGKIAAYGVVIAIAFGLFYAAIARVKHNAFNAGVKANQAQVDKALDQLKRDAQASATKADDKAAARTEVFVEQHTADKEALEDAERNGTSPLDALFGG